MSDLLLSIPENPTPVGAAAGFVRGPDGVRSRYAIFKAEGPERRGTVVLLQGRNETIEKYFETVRDLRRRGFGVALLDLRGQGGSDRMLKDPQRGHVDDFRSYVQDLEIFFDEVVLPDCRAPFHLVGHSTGSLVALLAAPALVNRIQRMVLVAPLLEFGETRISTAAIGRFAGFLYALGFGTTYLGSGRRSPEPGAFETNVLTSDAARHARNAALFRARPGLFLGGPTVAWVRAACIAARTVADPDYAATIRTPTLLIAAGRDTVVSTPAVEGYAGLLRSGSSLTIDGARHEILQEADRYREQFWAAFDAFVTTAYRV